MKGSLISNLTSGFRQRLDLLLLCVALVLPICDLVLPEEARVADLMRPIFIFAILGLGLNIVTGYTGLLNLGTAAFMAIGAYTYAILTCDIYPFQIGFWPALGCTVLMGTMVGFLLGLPTISLRGDYLAVVTLGFGEIIQDCLRNFDVITKGTQGINPLPHPNFFGYEFRPDQYVPWYYLLLGLLALVVLINRNLMKSRIGRQWIAIREDELASACMGVNPVKTKLIAFATGAAVCSLAGALWANHLGSSGEPANYDFQLSIIALCIVIIGGMGSIPGVLIGALILIGFNSIFLVKLSDFLADRGITGGQNMLSSPSNWKFLIFGLALVLMMRFKPEGLLPSRTVRAKFHGIESDEEDDKK